MSMQELVDKYFDQIEVEDADFLPVNDSTSDMATLLLNLPTEMLQEYQTMMGNLETLPDGAEFWMNSGLVERLRKSKKIPLRSHEPPNDILDFLKGEVCGDYQRLNDAKRIRLSIQEVLG
jgi:hypothetical protein